MTIITNVLTYAVLTATGEWTMQGSFMPCPDEIVVRQITFSSAAPTNSLLVVQSNLGMLGSVVTTNFASNPGTRIQMRNPIAGPLTFKLFVPTQTSLTPATINVGDSISIAMDFIKN